MKPTKAETERPLLAFSHQNWDLIHYLARTL